MSTLSPETQIKMIALAVAKLMGGNVNPEHLSEYNYKFKISELKLKLGTNVLPIGQINQGTFYHRALLFKALADRIGLKPCSLVRGEYVRAWNIIDLKTLIVSPPPKSAQGGRRVQSSRLKNKQDPAAATPVQAPTLSPSEQRMLYVGTTDIDAKPYGHDDVAIVDLMFEPGRLIPAQSPEAVKYQRQY